MIQKKSLVILVCLLLVLVSCTSQSKNETPPVEKLHDNSKPILVGQAEQKQEIKDNDDTTINKISLNKTIIINNKEVLKEDITQVVSEEYYILQFIGPVKESWKQELAAQGVTFYDYISYYAFKVQLQPETLSSLKEKKYVKSISVYKPDYKFTSELEQIFDKKGEAEKIEVNVVLHKEEDVQTVMQTLAELEDVEVISSGGNIITIAAAKNDVEKIVQENEVDYIEKVSDLVLYNDKARVILGAGEIESVLELDGGGQTIGILDTGLDTGDSKSLHADFGNRVESLELIDFCIGCTSPDDEHGHGTHVAGSAVGDGTKSDGLYRGTAPGAELVFTAMGTDSGGLSLLASGSNWNSTLYDVYDLNARFHSNSWGSNSGFGTYNTLSRIADEFMSINKDMLILFAAGNSGLSGQDTVGYPGTAKNVLTIGSSYNAGYGDTDTVVSSSSQGPTDDGRVKPDLLAPGEYVTSTKSSVTGVGDYTTMTGTSMATPLAAGTAALVRQHLVENENVQDPSAALVKALLINGADVLEGYSFPSMIAGWGRINVSNTIAPPAYVDVQFVDDDYSINATGDSLSFVYEAGEVLSELKITIVWTDPAADTSATITLVNNLDVNAISPSGEVYNGNDFTAPYDDTTDTINNVEQLVITNPDKGNWTFKIKGENIPQGPQPFALVLRVTEGINAPENVTISEDKDDKIVLSWTSVDNAESYNIYYSDNLTEIENINLEAAIPTFIGVEDIQYTDTESSTFNQRYYRIGAVNSSRKSLSETILVVYDIAFNGSTGKQNEGIEMNTFSVPLTAENLSITHLFDSGAEYDTIYSYHHEVNQTKLVQYTDGLWSGDFSEFEYGRGYVLKPFKAMTIRLIGKVPQGNYSTTVLKSTGEAGIEREMNLLGWFSLKEQCELNSVLTGASDGDTIYHYDTILNAYESAEYNNNSWSGDLNCFKPGQAYEFRKVNSDYTFTYAR